MKSLKYWLTISFITFLLLVFIELFIRLSFPSIQPEGCDKKLMQDFVYGSSMGLVPNSKGIFFGKMIHTDNHRARRNNKFFNKKKKTWLHLGDSVTMGVGVDDDATFSALISKEIDSVNIINLSMIGYAVNDYSNIINYLVTDKKNELNIHHITIFYCLNDIYQLPFIEHPSPSFTFFNFVKSHYITYIALKGILFDRPNAMYQYDKMFYTKGNHQLQETKEKLLTIQSFCAAHQIEVDLIVLPYLSPLHNQENTSAEFNVLRDELERDSTKETIPMYDFSRAFAGAKNPEKYYLFGDGIHFSTLGHQQIYSYYQQVFFKK
jgi:hypothetical protein